MNISAQNWDMLKEGKSWNILSIGYTPDLTSYIAGTEIIKFEGDTLVNDTLYKKVWQSKDSLKTKWGHLGFVREVADSGLYYRNSEGIEWMMYKYNLKLGELFDVKQNGFTIATITANKIDSVLINGIYKKRYSFSYSFGGAVSDNWIEGIGSMYGILYPNYIGVTGGTNRLLCSYNNDVLMYKNSDYSNCFYNPETSIQKVLDGKNNLTIYPNPSRDILNIKVKQESNVFIFNANGISIENINIPSLSEFQLNVKNYPKGIYFISSSKYLNGSLKFIKE